MNYNVYSINLDVLDYSTQLQIRAKQGDTARKIQATFRHGSYPYTIADGYTAIMVINRGENPILKECPIIDNAIVEYQFDEVTTQMSGIVDCEIRIINEFGEIITSPRFTILVDESLYNDGDPHGLLHRELSGRDESNQHPIDAIEGLQSALNDKASQGQIEDANRRIDNLMNIPSGSTSADAALYDIKVGYNGITYPTPGDAVRGQVKEVADKANKVDFALSASGVESYTDRLTTDPSGHYARHGIRRSTKYFLKVKVDVGSVEARIYSNASHMNPKYLGVATRSNDLAIEFDSESYDYIEFASTAMEQITVTSVLSTKAMNDKATDTELGLVKGDAENVHIKEDGTIEVRKAQNAEKLGGMYASEYSTKDYADRSISSLRNEVTAESFLLTQKGSGSSELHDLVVTPSSDCVTSPADNAEGFIYTQTPGSGKGVAVAGITDLSELYFPLFDTEDHTIAFYRNGGGYKNILINATSESDPAPGVEIIRNPSMPIVHCMMKEEYELSGFNTISIPGSNWNIAHNLYIEGGEGGGYYIKVDERNFTEELSERINAIESDASYARDEVDKIDDTLETINTQLAQTSEELEIRLKQPFIPNEGAKTLTDSDDGYMRELKLYGESEQKQYSGYNMVCLENSVYTRGGLTVTVNNNVITVEGTETSGSNVDFTLSTNITNYVAGAKYLLVIEGNVASNSGLIIRPYSSYGNFQMDLSAVGTSSKISGAWSSSYLTSNGVMLRVNANTVVAKTSFQIMVAQSDSVIPYEPFVGGQPSPSPSYPQKIESVGENMGCVDLGTLDWKKTSYSGGGYFFFCQTPLESAKAPINTNTPINGYCTDFAVKATNGSDSIYNGGGIGLSDVKWVFVYDSKYFDYDAQSFKQAMNGVLLAYELAEGATPSQYAVAMEVVGKNVLDATLQTTTLNGVTCTNNGDGTYTLNGTASSQVIFVVANNISFVGTRRLVGCVSGQSTTTMFLQLNSANIAKNDVGTGTNLESNGSDVFDVRIVVRANIRCDNVVFKPMLVDATKYPSATYADYEPYTKQTVIIPLSSPLYGIGDAVDYIDVERGVIVRNVEKGTVKTVKNLTVSDDYGDYAYIDNVISKVDNGSPNFLCDSFIGIPFADRVKNSNAYRCYVDNNNNGRLVLRFPKGVHKTVAEINAILENAEYYFVSATPTEEPIPAETLDLLRDLRTYYPATNIAVTDGKFDVDTEFLYKLRLESYVKKVTGQITDTRKTIDNINARQIDVEAMTALAYVNSEYATALAELN